VIIARVLVLAGGGGCAVRVVAQLPALVRSLLRELDAACDLIEAPRRHLIADEVVLARLHAYRRRTHTRAAQVEQAAQRANGRGGRRALAAMGELLAHEDVHEDLNAHQTHTITVGWDCGVVCAVCTCAGGHSRNAGVHR
jgi:hypothetical protein